MYKYICIYTYAPICMYLRCLAMSLVEICAKAVADDFVKQPGRPGPGPGHR